MKIEVVERSSIREPCVKRSRSSASFVSLERIADSISVRIVDRIGSSWDEWYGRLKHHKEREGHCRVPLRHEENGFALGKWVGHQRALQGTMSDERRQRLNALGFVWDPFETDWEEGFRYLTQYKVREGHCRVPARYSENGFKLGHWVNYQRSCEASISDERRQRLDALGFVWDPLETDWDKGFGYLKAYVEREGHCRVPASHEESSGFRLGPWVNTQRLNEKSLSDERRQRLDALGFVWGPIEADWDKCFIYLKAYVEREGHCRVPARHIENGFKLGYWVGNNRKSRNASFR